MILRPLLLTGPPHPSRTLPRQHTPHTEPCASAWAAVERQQKQAADEWWLIAQPDHAALAADLAARLETPLIPKLDAETIEGISLHDAGWAHFDGGERGTGRNLEVSLLDPQLSSEGRPLSFLDLSATNILCAWEGSITRAAKASAIGGILVSEHFCRIARERLRTKADTPDDIARLNHFIRMEEDRQKPLRESTQRTPQEISVLTDVLQFCDLLSLYLCCGSRERVEFPHRFSGVTIQAYWQDDALRTEPPLFGSGASLGVTGRRYPIFSAMDVSTIGFLIQ